MSELFKSPFPTFYKSDGVTVNSMGYLHFYEPGSGTTDKDIYADKTLSSTRRLTNPVKLGLTGQLETNVYLNGDYKVVLKDSSGVTIDTVQNYSPPDFSSQFNSYDSSVTYNIPDYAIASNNRVYRSLTNGNTGNEPSASPENWEEIYFTSVYNQYRSYEEDDIVKFGDDYFVSLEDDNLGNEPSSTSTYWRSFFRPGEITGYSASSFEYRGASGSIGTFYDAYANILIEDFQSVGPTGSGAENIWASMDIIPVGAKAVIVKMVATTARDTSDDQISIYAQARVTGDTTDDSATAIASSKGTGGLTEIRIGDVTEFIVNLDSSRRFDFYWSIVGDNIPAQNTVKLYLMGFKV